MAILKVGMCTGPVCSSSLYSNPGLSSFKARQGFFRGWKALLLFFFFFPLFENNSGKCILGTGKKQFLKSCKSRLWLNGVPVFDSIVFKNGSREFLQYVNFTDYYSVLQQKRSTTNRSIIPNSQVKDNPQKSRQMERVENVTVFSRNFLVYVQFEFDRKFKVEKKLHKCWEKNLSIWWAIRCRRSCA